MQAIYVSNDSIVLIEMQAVISTEVNLKNDGQKNPFKRMNECENGKPFNEIKNRFRPRSHLPPKSFRSQDMLHIEEYHGLKLDFPEV